MDVADSHLETVLEELNDKVNALESSGGREELMEAYANRGFVLSMMDYRTSALDDLVSAADILDDLESGGAEIDPGLFFKIHCVTASVLSAMGQDPGDEYALAASRIGAVNARSRGFDARSLIRLCVDSAEDLMDSDEPEGIVPYIGKALDLTQARTDPWSLNMRFHTLRISAEASEWLEDIRTAVDVYGEAVDVGLMLMGEGRLDDPSALAMALVSKAQCEGTLGMDDMRLMDLDSAVKVMENLMECGRSADPDILVGMHHDLADALMKAGRIDEAEKHLIRAMELGVNGAGDYMRMHTPSGRSS